MKFDSQAGQDGKRRKKFAIVGFAESTRHLAPYEDDGWEIHGMNQLYRHIPRATGWWEMHSDYMSDEVPGTDYKKWLHECPIPVHMIKKDPNIPNSVEYPIEEMAETFGDYFYSTISYMIAYAIAEGYEEIGLWGIDLAHDSEYEYQKPSAEYLLGIAIGRGIKVHLPKTCALLRGMYRYGYQDMPSNEDIQWLKVYTSRVKDAQVDLIGRVNQLQGQINAAEEFAGWARSKRRGSSPPPEDAPVPDDSKVE